MRRIDRLVSEFGFTGGESTVRQYVREIRPRREVMIPLDHDPGEAQVDWGEAQVYLDGHLTKAHLFCLRLCYSQRFFVMAFPRDSQEAFFAGHVAAFQESGGVPKVIVYDNLVHRRQTGADRLPPRRAAGFYRFSLPNWYNSERKRIVQARFPILKTLDEFQFAAIPALNRQAILELAQGNYIEAKENAVFLGPTGTGKTHLAVTLGLAACRQGHRVRFTSAAGLINQLMEAQAQLRLSKLEPWT